MEEDSEHHLEFIEARTGNESDAKKNQIQNQKPGDNASEPKKPLMTETNSYRLIFLCLIVGIIFSVIVKNMIFIGIFTSILLYHIYSSYKYKTWPLNAKNNPDSDGVSKKNSYWTEFLAVAIAIVVIYYSITNLKNSKSKLNTVIYILFLIWSSILLVGHGRQIFAKDGNYYEWMVFFY